MSVCPHIPELRSRSSLNQGELSSLTTGTQKVRRPPLHLSPSLPVRNVNNFLPDKRSRSFSLSPTPRKGEGERALLHLPALRLHRSLPSLTRGSACHHSCRLCFFSPIPESQHLDLPQQEAALCIPRLAGRAEMGQAPGCCLHYRKNNPSCSVLTSPMEQTSPRAEFQPPQLQSQLEPELLQKGPPETHPGAAQDSNQAQCGRGAEACPGPPALGLGLLRCATCPFSPTARGLSFGNSPILLTSVCPMNANPLSAMKWKALLICFPPLWKFSAVHKA